LKYKISRNSATSRDENVVSGLGRYFRLMKIAGGGVGTGQHIFNIKTMITMQVWEFFLA
jgi:hypothetical protein